MSLLKTILNLRANFSHKTQDYNEEGAKLIKECYSRIPPGLYDEVQKHFQEMVHVGVICPSNSPWACAVMLLRKKNGKLGILIVFH